MAKQRDEKVDVLRGVAALLVVLGHTITGTTQNGENSFLYNIVWSLQIPLFILISGYVVKHSREIIGFKGLLVHLKRRTIAYLLPWGVWVFCVRGLILGDGKFLDIGYVVYHMDSAYWFLYSLWSISVIFAVSQYLAHRCTAAKRKRNEVIFTFVFCLIGAALLAVAGVVFGFSFLCIKLTLYYMPFYLCGYLWGKVSDTIKQTKRGTAVVDIVIALSAVVYLACLLRYNLYSMPDQIPQIGIRVLTSLCGCITVCGLLCGLIKDSQLKRTNLLLIIGEYSLEIYLCHTVLQCLIRMAVEPDFTTPTGMALVAVNFVVTTALSLGVAKLLHQNKWLRKFLFGKN